MDPKHRTLRSKAMQETYYRLIAQGEFKKGCALCSKEAVQAFKHWKIVKNDFPYDLVAETHDMIVPLRHVDTAGISGEEWGELQTIKQDYINPRYQFTMEATNWNQSIPSHFHLHLILIKPDIVSCKTLSN
jgi:hypothetical protein